MQRTLDEQELAKLLRTAAGFKSPRRERETALITLLTDSGLRAAEVCRLPIANIDLRAGLLIVIRGMRISVAQIFAAVAAGVPQEVLLEEYPGLVAEDIQAALQYAADLLASERVFSLHPSA